MSTLYMVYRKHKFLGIIESNERYARAYWSQKKGIKLVPVRYTPVEMKRDIVV